MSTPVPGPPTPALLQTLQWAYQPTRYLEANEKRYGTFWVSRLVGFSPLVHLSEPDLICELFKQGDEVFQAGRANQVLRPILGGASLFLLDGKQHLNQRRALNAPLQAAKSSLQESDFAKLIHAHFDRWDEQTFQPLLPKFRSLTLSIILRTVFGPLSEVDENFLQRTLAALLDGLTSPILLLPRAQIPLGGLTPWKRLMDLKQDLDRWIFRRIAEEHSSLSPGSHLLSKMTGSPEVIRDEVMTLIVAGHDTLAAALTWIVEHLGLNPEALAQLREETAELLRTGGSATGGTTPWLDAVINESLRLTPVLPIVARTAVEDVCFMGFHIPKGWRIAPNIYLTHRNERYWERPLAFDPRRFINGKPGANCFLPFGGGARRCIGMSYSMQELRLILPLFLQRFSFERESQRPARCVRRGVVFVPDETSKFRLGRRA